MSRHFSPPIELPDHVQAYAQGLADHKADYGEVPENAPKELQPIVKEAKDLEALSHEIENLELTLAAKKEAYYKKAMPLWTAFSEKLGYAKVYAQKNDRRALLNFLRNYQHHVKGHAAAKAAEAPQATKTVAQ